MEASARRLSRKPPVTDMIAVPLLSALYAENLSFTTYGLMVAVRDFPDPPISVARLSIVAGMSYHAVRNQILRAPWFLTDHAGPLVTVSLIPEALDKLDRVACRLARN